MVLGILTIDQDFYRAGGAALKSSGENNPKSVPTPCKIQSNPTQRTTTLFTNRVQLSKQKKICTKNVKIGFCEGWGEEDGVRRK